MDVQTLWFTLQQFIEAHGWKLLTVTLLLVVAQRQYKEYALAAHAQRALADANDPSRVAVLQRETARIRDAQQERLAQASAAAATKSKRKSKRAE